MTTTLQNKATKGRTIAYWTITILLTAGMLSGGIAQLLRAKANADGIIHLGYPLYLLTILGVWKVAGVLVLLLPGFTLLKEWAYAGFFFLMTGAVISHLASGDGITGVIYQSIFVIFIVLSWYLRPVNRRIAV
jgi:uncharacterized membrane protein YphA (DoxX/SURF4 family)